MIVMQMVLGEEHGGRAFALVLPLHDMRIICGAASECNSMQYEGYTCCNFKLHRVNCGTLIFVCRNATENT